MNDTFLTSWWRLAVVLGISFAVLMVLARWVVDGGVTTEDVGVAAVSGVLYGLLMGPWTARARSRSRRRGAQTAG